MKKLAFIMAVLVTMGLGSCNPGSADVSSANNNTIKQSSNMSKTLVVYFSATGTTKAAAQRLAKQHNADLYEITPVQPYTAADLKKAYPQYTWDESRLMN